MDVLCEAQVVVSTPLVKVRLARISHPTSTPPPLPPRLAPPFFLPPNNYVCPTLIIAVCAQADIEVPGAISLAPDRSLAKARVRVGIALMGEKISKKIKVYGGAGSYPDTYAIRLTFYGYDKEGTIVERTEFKSELRCERAGYG